jgi:hypothetical protein
MQEGQGGSGPSGNPAALRHEHSKAHHIGKSFASAHGHDHEGSHPAPMAGPQPGPENVSSTGVGPADSIDSM